jgi:hypothetical protein
VLNHEFKNHHWSNFDGPNSNFYIKILKGRFGHLLDHEPQKVMIGQKKLHVFFNQKNV